MLKSHQDYTKAYHLNTVNGLYSRLKDMLYCYRGVSGKYLNRYLAIFTALEYVKCSVLAPEVVFVRQLVAGINTVKPIRSLSSEGILYFDGQVQNILLTPFLKLLKLGGLVGHWTGAKHQKNIRNILY